MNIVRWLDARAHLSPERPALMHGTRVETDYAAFASRAAGVAAGLRAGHGVASGDRVAIWMKNSTEYLEALFGIMWAGAAAVPINFKLHPREVDVILRDSGASAVIVAEHDDGETASIDTPVPMIRAGGAEWEALRTIRPLMLPAERHGDDLAWLFYTSGTTGRPKGVMLTHNNLIAASLCYPVDVDPVRPDDACLYAAPMSLGAGLYSFIHCRVGARHVVAPSAGFDPDEILNLAKQIGDVSFFAAPTMVRRLVERARAIGANGEGIRTIVYGGGPMYLADIEEAVAVLGPRFVQIYGQGESPMTITALSRDHIVDRASSRWRERLASVGTTQSCVEVRIADPQGVALPPGEIGEVLVSGPQVMKGYWQNEEATNDALRGGWLWTGDLGRLDEDGFLTLTDRSKDLIISGGSNIYPREVEEALLAHPDVVEASVVGRPSAEWGEEVVAFVVIRPGIRIGPPELEAHCNNLIARFKRPKVWLFVDELPKNNYGKVLKTELRSRLAS